MSCLVHVTINTKDVGHLAFVFTWLLVGPYALSYLNFPVYVKTGRKSAFGAYLDAQ